MFSIIICCYNSTSRITKTLLEISKLKTDDFCYEVILVDNNSSDKTSQLAKDIWQNNGSNTVLKVVYEKIPGQTFARKKGVSHASGQYILFCDDDNWLKDDYLIKAKKILQSRQDIGALGGWSEGVFEIQPPEWFLKISNCFAVGGMPDEKLMEADYIWGAGMIIRSDLAKKIFNQNFSNSGRSGKILTSGDDVEICSKIKTLNYKVFKSSELFFKHFITKERLTIDYLRRLYIGFGYSSTKKSFIEYNKPMKYLTIHLVRTIYILSNILIKFLKNNSKKKRLLFLVTIKLNQ